MTTWTVSDARAQFATLLAAAREQGPQRIRQAGHDEVTVSRSDQTPRGLPMSYIADGLARSDGMRIALAQYRLQQDGYGDNLVAKFHLPPNLSGDVLAWVLREKGALDAAGYVVSSLKTMRQLQGILDLPFSTAVQVVKGLQLTAGAQRVFSADSLRWIERQVEGWSEPSVDVLGPDWPGIADYLARFVEGEG